MPTDTQSPAGSGNNQSKFDNYSLDFDGATQRIICPYNAIFDQAEYSISLWVKNGSNSTGGDKGILCADSGTRGWAILQNDQTLKINPNISGGGTQVNTSNFFSNTDTWIHCVITCDGTDLIVYKNGSSFNTDSGGTYALNANSNDLTIGDDPFAASREFAGNLDHCCIFDYALSETQVKYLYNNNAGGSTPNPQNPMAIPGNTPIAYYDLGGSSTGSDLDPATNPNTLTVPNSSVPSATVFDFNGTDDFIQLASSSTAITDWTQPYTISMWVNYTTSLSFDLMATFGVETGSAATSRYIMIGGSSGYLFTGVGDTDGGSTNIHFNIGSNLNDGNWHNIVYLGDGTSGDFPTVYIDGVVEAYSGGTTNLFNSSTYLNVIGTGSTATGRYFPGEISNTQIWNGNLSPAEVTTLYNNGVPYTGTQPQAANLKGWWRMNIDTSNWDGSNWEIGDNRSAYKKAIDTTGPSGGFKTSSTSLSDFMGNSATNFSFSMWIRGTIGDTSSSALASFAVPTSGYKNNIWNYNFYGGLCLLLDASNRIGFGQINDGKWKHVLITVDTNAGSNWDDVVKCFVNGQPQSHVPGKTIGSPPSSFDWLGSYNGVPSNQRSVGVGVGLGSYNSYHGDISNFTIYNSTLGQSEATTLYNNGTPVTTAVGSPLAWWKLNNLTDGLLDVSGNSYNIQALGSGQVVVDTLVSTSNGTSSGMTTANLVNSDLERSIPYSSYSMEFDGTDYIDTGSLSVSGTNFSTSFWIKIDNQSSGGPWVRQQVFPAKNNINSTNYTIGHITPRGFITRQILQLQGTDNTGANPQTYTTQNINLLGTGWNHVVFTHDITTTNTYAYVNGVAQTWTAFSGTPTNVPFIKMPYTYSTFRIGAFNTSEFFEGSISNTAVFNKILSENEILTIYNGGFPNDISSLSPIAWWSLSGDSYYNGTDWIVPDLVGSNNGDSDGTMGGSELVGEGPGSEANGVGTGMNIPGNLQGNAPNSSSNAFSVNMNADDKTNDVPVVP